MNRQHKFDTKKETFFFLSNCFLKVHKYSKRHFKIGLIAKEAKCEAEVYLKSQNKLTPNHTNFFYKTCQFKNSCFKSSRFQKGLLKDRAKF